MIFEWRGPAFVDCPEDQLANDEFSNGKQRPPGGRLRVIGREGPSEQDWLTVMRQLCDTIRHICETPLVRGDYQAQRIIYDMLNAPSAEAFDTQMDRLAERVGVLLAAKTGDSTDATVALIKSARQGRASLRTAFNPHASLNDEPAQRPARTFLKL